MHAALRAGFEIAGVVTGHAGERIAEALADLPVHILPNPEFARGLSSSLDRAAEWAADRAGLLLLLGDEPGIDPDVIRRAAAAWRRARALAVRTRYRDRPGHPVVLAHEVLRAERPLDDRGFGPLFADLGSDLLELPVDAPAPIDVDTRADYHEALARLPQ